MRERVHEPKEHQMKSKTIATGAWIASLSAMAETTEIAPALPILDDAPKWVYYAIIIVMMGVKTWVNIHETAPQEEKDSSPDTEEPSNSNSKEDL